jgi:hypothetical protein
MEPEPSTYPGALTRGVLRSDSDLQRAQQRCVFSCPQPFGDNAYDMPVQTCPVGARFACKVISGVDFATRTSPIAIVSHKDSRAGTAIWLTSSSVQKRTILPCRILSFLTAVGDFDSPWPCEERCTAGNERIGEPTISAKSTVVGTVAFEDSPG